MGNPVPDTKENAELCICPSCPTYKQSSLSGTLFCARGKASEKAKTAGCICPDCAVYKNQNLSQMYYCLQGASEALK